MKMNRMMMCCVVMMTASGAMAATVPFTETFAGGNANWVDAISQPLGWSPAGGPDNSAHVTTSFNFVNSLPTDTPALFRAQSFFNASNQAFVGNYIAEGVTGLSFFVRHSMPAPVTFFTRFASPVNFPAAVNVNFVPVFPNTWTQINVSLPNNFLIFEGPFTYEQVFSNIGNIQIGIEVAGAAGINQPFTFDLDTVSLLPEPGSLALLLVGSLALRRQR